MSKTPENTGKLTFFCNYQNHHVCFCSQNMTFIGEGSSCGAEDTFQGSPLCLLLCILCCLSCVEGSELSSVSLFSSPHAHSTSLLILYLFYTLLSVFFALILFVVLSSNDIVSMPKGADAYGTKKKRHRSGKNTKKSTSESEDDYVEEDEEAEGGRKRRKKEQKGAGGRPKSAASPSSSLCNHAQARERVCIVCLCYFSRNALTKGVLLSANTEYALEFIEFYLADLSYSQFDPRLPRFLCFSCRSACKRAYSNESPPPSKLTNQNTVRQSLVHTRTSWRSFVCPGEVCPLCKLAVYHTFGRRPSIVEPPQLSPLSSAACHPP